jgi:hypothetical protein
VRLLRRRLQATEAPAALRLRHSEITKSRKVFPRTVVLASSGKLSINQVRKLS